MGIMEKLQVAKKVGENIKRLRKERGISQSELARLCFKDKQAIEKIENGKVNPTLYSLYLIALALGIKTKELIEI